MTLTTLFRYLLLDREAINQIAHCRAALWLGLAFVLLAAIARDYDGVDLMAQPIHLLVPTLASLITASLLFVYLQMFRWAAPQPLTYRQFLTYFWLTGPLAWLYAIPVERFLSAGDSAAANLWFLAVVSLWRVMLISRVISIRNDSTFFAAVVRVLLFADTIVLIALYFTPLPVFNIMGGVRLSPRDQIILGTALNVGFGGIVLWPILLICNLVLGRVAVPADSQNRNLSEPDKLSKSAAESDITATTEPVATVSTTRPVSEGVSSSTWSLAGGLLCLSFGMLIFGQPEQQKRFQAEHLLRSNQIAAGLEYMSRFEQDDFPPHWAPPPAISWREEIPHPIDQAIESLHENYKPWVRQACLNNFIDYFGEYHMTYHQWNSLDEARFRSALRVLAVAPDLDPTFLKDSHECLQDFARDPKNQYAQMAVSYLKQIGRYNPKTTDTKETSAEDKTQTAEETETDTNTDKDPSAPLIDNAAHSQPK